LVNIIQENYLNNQQTIPFYRANSYKHMKMQAVIMVGGEGFRLRPFTYTIPKPLLPIGDLTILESLVKSLIEQGFQEIILITCYQHRKFEQCTSYKKKYGGKITLYHEKKKMGTVGAISKLQDQLNNNFLLMNGDLVVEMDFASFYNYHVQQSADITIGITPNEIKNPYGVVESDKKNRLVRITEKPKENVMINTGIYALNSSVFSFLKSDEYMDMPVLINRELAGNKKILTYKIGNKWLDTGYLENYEIAIEIVEKWKLAKGKDPK
jgi:NDP-sugar pyrophosphorylase family protein